MAFQCGFFNSENGDRKYNAEQMNNPYKRIVSNGVFAQPNGTPSTDYQVTATDSMVVNVKEGRGIFADKWAVLDADMQFTVPAAHVSYDRIDSVIVRIDNRPTVRAGSILYRSGEPDENPQAPELENTSNVKEYRLANIAVAANATVITQANITDTRPGSECGFIHNLLWDSDISATYAQWQAQFDEWFVNIKRILATATIISSFTSNYTAVVDNETDIPVNISNYNPDLDVLEVYTNGLHLTAGVDYSLGENDNIILTLGVDAGTQINIIVYKSIDGSQAETVVRYVNELLAQSPVGSNGTVEVSVPAAGNVLLAFTDSGVGLHTMFSASGADNAPKQEDLYYIGHLASASYGWLIAYSVSGDIYFNFLNNGLWRGWKALFEVNPAALYYSAEGVFPNTNQVITPGKTLSNCRNGWALEFSGYDTTNNSAVDSFAQTVFIPKKSYKNANWNGESYCVALPFEYDSSNDDVSICMKKFAVYDDRIISDSVNATGKQRNIVLRAIYEY